MCRGNQKEAFVTCNTLWVPAIGKVPPLGERGGRAQLQTIAADTGRLTKLIEVAGSLINVHSLTSLPPLSQPTNPIHKSNNDSHQQSHPPLWPLTSRRRLPRRRRRRRRRDSPWPGRPLPLPACPAALPRRRAEGRHGDAAVQPRLGARRGRGAGQGRREGEGQRRRRRRRRRRRQLRRQQQQQLHAPFSTTSRLQPASCDEPFR